MGRGAATSLMRINDVERSAPGDVDDPAGARYLRWRTTDSRVPGMYKDFPSWATRGRTGFWWLRTILTLD
jgi:hypothetical protein